MRPTRLAVLAVLLVSLSACGSDDDTADSATTATSAATSTTAAATESATVKVAETSLGEVLVDDQGRTLYVFTKDTPGKSACEGQCATTWPPLAATGTPTAGAGIDAAKLGTISRPDGSSQVTIADKPLYRFAADTAPGEVKGHNVGGNWFAVRADGSAVPATTEG